jgi:hypothetical protein
MTIMHPHSLKAIHSLPTKTLEYWMDIVKLWWEDRQKKRDRIGQDMRTRIGTRDRIRIRIRIGCGSGSGDAIYQSTFSKH